MSDFGSALERVRKHFSAIEKLERLLALRPGDRKLQLEIISLRRLAQESEKVFELASSRSERDIVRYKIENESDQYFISSVADSCSAFQKTVTAICDAIKNGPKQRAQFADDIVNATALNFAYTFPGSVGLVLSIDNKRDLFSGYMDTTLDAFRQISTIDNEDNARDASRKLGLAAISSFSEWVNVNVKWRNNINYIWKKSDGSEYGQFLSVSQLTNIHEILSRAEDVETSRQRICGKLVGLDTKDGRFHFEISGQAELKGGLSPSFLLIPRTVNKFYDAIIRTDIIRNISTGKETTKHFLEELIDIEPPK